MEVKEIPSIPGYGASDCGLIFKRSGVAWLEVKQRWMTKRKPYKTVRVPISGKRRTRFVHRLVLEAFCGPCPKGMVTRHLNDVGTDNRLENLKWGTHKENGEDKVTNKLQPWGEVHHKAVFTESQIIEMRRLWNKGATATELQKIFGGKIAAIHHACIGKNWQHIECDDPNAQPSVKPKSVLTAFGETKTYSQWANDDRCSVASPNVIRARIKRGIPPDRAIADPPWSTRGQGDVVIS